MNTITVILYAIISVSVSVTAVIHFEGPIVVDSPADKIRDHAGKCYIEELGLFDNKEYVRLGEKCQTVKCLGNEKGQYETQKCESLIVEPPCYPVYSNEKPFPECCTFKVECLEVPVPKFPRRKSI